MTKFTLKCKILLWFDVQRDLRGAQLLKNFNGKYYIKMKKKMECTIKNCQGYF